MAPAWRVQGHCACLYLPAVFIYFLLYLFASGTGRPCLEGSSSASMEIPQAGAPEPLLSDLAACTQLQIFNLQ